MFIDFINRLHGLGISVFFTFAWSADDVKNSEKLVKQFEQRREAMQEYDASQRFDFDHLMAPATVVGSTTHAKWSPSISNDDRVRLGAFTAMQLKLERWTNDVL